VANTSALLSAVAVTRTFASMYCTASQTDGDTSMAGRRRCSRRGTCVCRGDGARRPGADGPICRARLGIGWGRSPRS
jgi:hypothetical protein